MLYLKFVVFLFISYGVKFARYIAAVVFCLLAFIQDDYSFIK